MEIEKYRHVGWGLIIVSSRTWELRKKQCKRLGICPYCLESLPHVCNAPYDEEKNNG